MIYRKVAWIKISLQQESRVCEVSRNFSCWISIDETVNQLFLKIHDFYLSKLVKNQEEWQG